MAACWALEPAPLSEPLSCLALLLAAVPVLALEDSLEAPHAASAREPASAVTTVTARVLLLSVKSMPLGRPGRRCRAGDNDRKVRQHKWTHPGARVNSG